MVFFRMFIKSICRLFFIFVLIITSLTACDKGGLSTDVSVIHRDSFVGSKGIIYEDIKSINYRCYFDFNSKTNLLLCFDPDCNHTSVNCTARQGRPYTFYLEDKLYYIETNMITYTDYSQAVISCLYKCDNGNREAETVAEFEGSPVSDVYIKDNALYVIAADYKPLNSAASNLYYLYCIDLKKNSVLKTSIPLKGGLNENYIPLGFADNKIILYHRFYDRIIKPSDYGLEGDIIDYKNNKKSYNEYMKELNQVFHEDMYSLDLSSGKLKLLPLPVPLLIHDGTYYYNKMQSDGSYSLMALAIGTNKEKEILDRPAYAVDAIDTTLFITEGAEEYSDITGKKTISVNINNAKFHLLNTETGVATEVTEPFFNGTDAQIKLIAEYEDYYIFIYSSLNEGVSQRIGYIRKNDFFNGQIKCVLAVPI